MLSKIFSRAGRKLAAVCLVTATTFLSGLAVHAASNVDGAIEASIVTQAGDGVSGATVTVTNVGTGFSRTLTTNADGEVRFSSLQVGTYDVSVSSSAGNATRSGVVVNVGTGTSVTLIAGGDTAELGGLSVTANVISPIDITSTESATILGEATIDRLPVGRNLTAVALLAPGTTLGDTAFGNLASFGGSTVGENVCYINGLNVTNFRNGLGCGSVPFEFYQEFQLKTGGYSAEFGRSTGGVVNAVTKSGTNDFHYGVNFYYSPWIENVSGVKNDVFRQNGALFQDNSNDESDDWSLNLYASGPIVKDKAFFYVLYNPRESTTKNFESGTAYVDVSAGELLGRYNETSSDDAFWGVKLDWNLSSNHTLELTAFSDSASFLRESYEFIRNEDTANVFNDGTIGDFNSSRVFDEGGTNALLKYTGYLTPDFTLSVMYGSNSYDLSSYSSEPGVAAVIDYDNGPGVPSTAMEAGSNTFADDKRNVIRIDGEWNTGDHSLRFGLDRETLESNENTRYSGPAIPSLGDTRTDPRFVSGHFYQYFFDATGFSPAAGLVLLDRQYINEGYFETLSSAIYIEDNWQITDNLVASIGLRNEMFENSNKVGEAFVDITNQIAPRLGLSWDAFGDGSMKVFANYGRYFLPVANNTNARLAGDEYYWFDWIYADAINSDGSLVNPRCVPDDEAVALELALPGEHGCGYLIASDGNLKPTKQIVDQELDPMYQDEFIFGVLRDMGNGWSVGVRAAFRDLKRTLEDISLDAALEARGIPFTATTYVLTNPGTDVTVDYDTDGDGNLERITLTADELNYPIATRKYNAVEFLFERAWDGVWSMQASYTWSQSYGNNEGFVRSDNGQDDAGLTTNYDYPGLTDGAYGYLPNDRRHALKVFGAWQLADNWQMSANMLMSSGRPINAFGVHPTDSHAADYGPASFFQQGQLVPRGTRGRTAFISSLDLGLRYMTSINNADVKFGIDMFNVFNSVNATEVWENADLATGAPDSRYGLPTSFQSPRSIRLSAEFEF